MDAPEEEEERTNTLQSCSNERMTNGIENLRKVMDGQEIIADTWTTSRRSIFPTAKPGTSGTGTKTSSYWYPMMMIDNLDRCEREKLSSPRRKLSQIFDENKDDSPWPFLLKPFPVRTCAVGFPVQELFWYCLFQVSTTQFCFPTC